MPVVINKFDTQTVIANPNLYPLNRLDTLVDGLYGVGLPPPYDYDNPNQGDANIRTSAFGPSTDAFGVVIDFEYNTAIPFITSFRWHNSGGGVLNDNDGVNTFDYEIYNSLSILIASGTHQAINSGAPSVESTGLLADVKRIRILNITERDVNPQDNGNFPYAGGMWAREIETVTPAIDCAAATNITFNSATANATGIQVPLGMFYEIRYGLLPGGPYDHIGPQVASDGSANQPISFSLTALEPNTTYYYQVVLVDPDDPENNVFPITSPVCSFTTSNAAVWCGGFYDPEECTFVDPGNNDPYLNCNEV